MGAQDQRFGDSKQGARLEGVGGQRLCVPAGAMLSCTVGLNCTPVPAGTDRPKQMCASPFGDQIIETMSSKKLGFPQESQAGRRSLMPASRGTCLLGRDFTQFDSLSDYRHGGRTGAWTMKVGEPHCDQGCLVTHASVYVNLNLMPGPLDGLEGGCWLCVPLPSVVTSSTSFLYSSPFLV